MTAGLVDFDIEVVWVGDGAEVTLPATLCYAAGGLGPITPDRVGLLFVEAIAANESDFPDEVEGKLPQLCRLVGVSDD